MKMQPIVFWFENPPRPGKGAFNYVANNWPNEVYYVFHKDFREERKKANWDDGDYGKAIIVPLYDHKDQEMMVKEIFDTHPKSIHIINGFLTPITKIIRPYILYKNLNVIAMSERPVQMGNWIEHTLRNIYFRYKYTKLRKIFEPHVKAFLPLGILGVQTFKRYGWPEQKMFPFMYNPPLINISNNSDKTIRPEVKFLYVGRFYYKTKGTDVLMKAISYLHGNWSLDLVGGYGINAEEVIKWANSHSRIKYKGTWDSSQVVSNMQKYDVVVVPTRYDGWNLLINEGIHAGIGVITTDQAVSHEVIEKTKSGIVVKSGSPKQLANAMQYAIDNPDIVSVWKQNAESNVNLITSETVGSYFISIIKFAIYNKGEKPKCPWF